MNICRWWNCANAAKTDLCDTESIAGPEGGANIVLTSDIVQYQNRRRFVRYFVLLDAYSLEFAIQKFSEHYGAD